MILPFWRSFVIGAFVLFTVVACTFVASGYEKLQSRIGRGSAYRRLD